MTAQPYILATAAEELHAVASALVGGARYGVKIRLPHALVMTMLFRKDLTSIEKIKSVLKLAFEHGYSLASFATIYKVGKNFYSIKGNLILSNQRSRF